MGHNYIRWGLLRTTAAIGLLSVSVAQAQTATTAQQDTAAPATAAQPVSNANGKPKQTAQAPDESLKEIVVTARRTAERIDRVPVSITAFNSSTLRQASISNTEELKFKTPGVYLSGSGGRDNTVYEIRGQSKTLSGDSPAAVVAYFAEVPMPNLGNVVPTFDLASVQVLKGPQGTLFGRNTTGGALLYEPVAPNYIFSGYAQATVGNYNTQQFEGAVNIPIVDDKVAMRVAGIYDHRDGYTKNLGGTTLDNVNTQALRVSLLLEPTDYIKNKTILDYYRDYAHGDGAQLVGILDTPSALDALGLRSAMLQQFAAQQARGPRVVDSDALAYQNLERSSITNKTEVSLGEDTSLINIFGYRSTRLHYSVNTDGVPVVNADGTGAYPAGTPVILINAALDSESQQISDEVQLHGKLVHGDLNYILGGFYLKEQPIGPTGSYVTIFQPVGAPFNYSYDFQTQRSRALFGNITYKLDWLLPGLKFNAGLRVSWDDIKGCTAGGIGLYGTARPNDCIGTNPLLSDVAVATTGSHAPTWSVGFDYQVTPDIFTYVASRHGYRTGGVNSPSLSGTLAANQTFQPETVTDLEIGTRTRWSIGDVKLRTNVSAFIGFYDEVQAALTGVSTLGGCKVGDPVFGQPPYSPDGDCKVANDPTGGTLIVNGGQTQVAGVDFDGLITPIRNVNISFGGTIIDPETTQLNQSPIIKSYLGSSDLPFNLFAKTTLTSGVQYHMPLGEDVGDLLFNVDAYYTSRLAFTNVKFPSYTIMNLRVDWNEIGGQPVDLSFYVKNLLDRDYIAIGDAAGSTLGFTVASYGPPRMFGAVLRYRFNE